MSAGRIYWVYILTLDIVPHRSLGRPVEPGDDSGGFGRRQRWGSGDDRGGVGASEQFDLASNTKWLAGHNKTCTSDVCKPLQRHGPKGSKRTSSLIGSRPDEAERSDILALVHLACRSMRGLRVGTFFPVIRAPSQDAAALVGARCSRPVTKQLSPARRPRSGRQRHILQGFLVSAGGADRLRLRSSPSR
jgi:hypothetical protein